MIKTDKVFSFPHMFDPFWSQNHKSTRPWLRWSQCWSACWPKLPKQSSWTLGFCWVCTSFKQQQKVNLRQNHSVNMSLGFQGSSIWRVECWNHPRWRCYRLAQRSPSKDQVISGVQPQPHAGVLMCLPHIWYLFGYLGISTVLLWHAGETKLIPAEFRFSCGISGWHHLVEARPNICARELSTVNSTAICGTSSRREYQVITCVPQDKSSHGGSVRW